MQTPSYRIKEQFAHSVPPPGPVGERLPSAEVGPFLGVARGPYVASTSARTLWMGWNCQECGQPLQLDRSLEEADQHTLGIAQATVKEALGQWNTVSSETRQTHLNALSLPSSVHQAIQKQLQHANSTPETLSASSDKQQYQTRLFQTLSTETFAANHSSALRHPLCEDCTKQVLDRSTQEIEIARKERNALREFEDDCTSEGHESARMQKRRSLRKEVQDVGCDEKELTLDCLKHPTGPVRVTCL